MASRSLNRVILIGNLTRDPELKYTPSGTAVCTFGVATNRSWTTAEGQTKEETQFHRIVSWQKLAELCGKLLTKGRKVFLEGRLTYRSFTGKDGVQRSISEIVLDDFIVFSDGKRVVEAEETEAHAPEEEGLVTDEELNHDTAAAEEPKGKKEKSEDVDPDDIPF
ncbi:MAG: single-stranded DNA-binding protein [Candidatus Roizmanbacteria bacterium]|nr:MAG: single-stranded DNA-binding protein [Candidatus Roizmanbacteria bacterium]